MATTTKKPAKAKPKVPEPKGKGVTKAKAMAAKAAAKPVRKPREPQTQEELDLAAMTEQKDLAPARERSVHIPSGPRPAHPG